MPVSGHHKWPRSIDKDWVGIKPPLDAAMVGRLSMTSTSSSASAASPPVPPGRRGKPRGSRRRKGKGRGSRHSDFWDDFALDYEEKCVLFTLFERPLLSLINLLYIVDVMHAIVNKTSNSVYDVLKRYFGAERRGRGHKKGRGRRPSLFDYNYDETDYTDWEQVQNKATPVQKVYFFQNGILFQTSLGTAYLWGISVLFIVPH